jgi:hypothetical protein
LFSSTNTSLSDDNTFQEGGSIHTNSLVERSSISRFVRLSYVAGSSHERAFSCRYIFFNPVSTHHDSGNSQVIPFHAISKCSTSVSALQDVGNTHERLLFDIERYFKEVAPERPCGSDPEKSFSCISSISKTFKFQIVVGKVHENVFLDISNSLSVSRFQIFVSRLQPKELFDISK